MDKDIFTKVRELIKKADTSDPEEFADYYGIIYVHLKGTIGGYATLYNNRYPIIGVNDNMSYEWRVRGGWHELTHVIGGHVNNEGFGSRHFDGTFFVSEVDSRTISRDERTANLVTADVTVNDGMVFDLIGYNNSTMRQYRRLKAYLDSLASTYEALRSTTFDGNPPAMLKAKLHDTRRQIESTSEAILDLESDMVSMNCCRTFSEMAGELNTPERVLRYKLEAMRIRGFDIDPQELEHYSKMFKGVI